MLIKYNNYLIHISKKIQGNCILLYFIFSKKNIIKYDQEFNNIHFWYLISNSTPDNIKHLWLRLDSKTLAYYNYKSTLSIKKCNKKCNKNLIKNYANLIKKLC